MRIGAARSSRSKGTRSRRRRAELQAVGASPPVAARPSRSTTRRLAGGRGVVGRHLRGRSAWRPPDTETRPGGLRAARGPPRCGRHRSRRPSPAVARRDIGTVRSHTGPRLGADHRDSLELYRRCPNKFFRTPCLGREREPAVLRGEIRARMLDRAPVPPQGSISASAAQPAPQTSMVFSTTHDAMRPRSCNTPRPLRETTTSTTSTAHASGSRWIWSPSKRIRPDAFLDPAANVGVIGGFNTRIQLYTVPGQVFYNTTRKLVLKGVDGMVFVADSQRAMKDANVESLANLKTNLAEIGIKLEEIPVVFQYNKRDLNNILAVAELEDSLNAERLFESYEACAVLGQGVFRDTQGDLTVDTALDSRSACSRRKARAARPAPLRLPPLEGSRRRLRPGRDRRDRPPRRRLRRSGARNVLGAARGRYGAELNQPPDCLRRSTCPRFRVRAGSRYPDAPLPEAAAPAPPREPTPRSPRCPSPRRTPQTRRLRGSLATSRFARTSTSSRSWRSSKEVHTTTAHRREAAARSTESRGRSARLSSITAKEVSKVSRSRCAQAAFPGHQVTVGLRFANRDGKDIGEPQSFSIELQSRSDIEKSCCL